MRQSTPQSFFRSGPDARDDLSLACNEFRFHGFHSRVNDPGLPLRFQPAASTTRSALRSATDSRFAPVSATSPLWPVAASATSLACRFPASTPLQDSYILPDQSVLPTLLQAGPPSETARFPFAPRNRSIASFRLRINVPESLLLRRLAVPQTSWNLLHYAPRA